MKRDGSVGIEVSRNHVVPCIVNAFVRLAIWLGTFTTLTWRNQASSTKDAPWCTHSPRPIPYHHILHTCNHIILSSKADEEHSSSSSSSCLGRAKSNPIAWLLVWMRRCVHEA